MMEEQVDICCIIETYFNEDRKRKSEKILGEDYQLICTHRSNLKKGYSRRWTCKTKLCFGKKNKTLSKI